MEQSLPYAPLDPPLSWGSTMPRVLNHKRDGLPRGAVYIGRQVPRYSLPRSKWANPIRLRGNASREEREEVIRQYERHLVDSGLIKDIQELRGKDLVCWCAPLPCHGDILLRLANLQADREP
jgi:hypothetical protein